MKRVYLAGPISGISFKESQDWRTEISRTLNVFNITPLSPLRGKKEILKNENEIKDSYDETMFGSKSCINISDYHDVKSSEALFVNLLGAERVSIGTVMEIAWAQEMRKPVVVIMEDDGNIHEHSMLTYNVIRKNNLKDGIEVILRLLGEKYH